MDIQEFKTTFDQAEEHFYAAKEELCRPEEDVVPYSVCRSSYQSIMHYLIAYLHKHQVIADESLELSEILESCRKIDPSFHKLNLSPLYHPLDSEDIWMNIAIAESFAKLAEKTRKMVGLL